MYTKGHYGISLLVYAPVGVGLSVSGYPVAAVVGGALMLALAMLPDCDHGLPFVDHRGPTHSVPFALSVGALLGAVTALFVDGTPVALGVEAGLFGFGVGTLAVVAHLVADLLTPMGIAPFWPVSARRYSLDVTPAKDPIANNLLLGVGVAATAGALFLLARVA